jgi:hypothetical protein
MAEWQQAANRFIVADRIKSLEGMA